MTRRVRRVLGGLLLALIGASTGIASLAVFDKGWGWWLLAVAAPLATTYGLPAGWFRIGFATGWLLVCGIALFPRPEGDYVFHGDLEHPRSYAFLAAALVVLILAFATLPPRGAPARPPYRAGSEESAQGGDPT